MLDTSDNRLFNSEGFSEVIHDDVVENYGALSVSMRERAPAPPLTCHSDDEEAVPHERIRDLTQRWSSAGDDATRLFLRRLPTSYGDAASEAECTAVVQAAVREQEADKSVLARAFRQALVEQRHVALPAIPDILDTCDALDDSREDANATLQLVQTGREQTGNAVRIIALYRRLLVRRALAAVMEQVCTWQRKCEAVNEHIHGGCYAEAAIMIGARLRTEKNRYFEREQSPSGSHVRWVAAAAAVADMDFEDFVAGVGEGIAHLACGRSVLHQYYELKRSAAAVIGEHIRRDCALLLTQELDSRLLVQCLKGLHALHVRGDAMSSFFLEIVDPILHERFRDALVDIVGEDAGTTWEDVAKTLVPSELHPCTTSLLSSLATTLRNILKVGEASATLAKTCEGNPSLFGNEGETRSVHDGFRFLSGVSSRVVHRCLAALVSYGSHANIQRGNVRDAMHVYRLLDLFADMCSTAVSDKSVESTRRALRLQWSALFADYYQSNCLDELQKLMSAEMFTPLPTTADDLDSLFMLEELEDETTTRSEIRSFLKLAPTLSLAPTLEEHLRLDVASNPFLSPRFVSPEVVSVGRVADRPLSLFEDHHPIFTFSSLMACKYMIEATNNVCGLAAAAGDVLGMLHSIACSYIDFITTHFVAKTLQLPLNDDPTVPASVQAHAATVRSTTQTAVGLCQGMQQSQFPYCPGAPCHSWRQRLDAANPVACVLERATAIASLTTVSTCHRLCCQALTGLLDVAQLATVADMGEAIGGLTKFATRMGFHQLSQSILHPDSIAVLVEKTKWDTEPSPTKAVSGSIEVLGGLRTRLRTIFRDMPLAAVRSVMDHCVLNTVMGFVEGLSRIKKVTDAVRSSILSDGLQLAQGIREIFPGTQQRLLDVVLKYARAMSGQWPDVLDLIRQSHALYTSKQLLAFGEREGFMKKREVDGLLRASSHEDRAPLHLLEE